MTPDFLENFEKVYAHIMASEELPRDKKKRYPSSRHDSDCSDSSDISQTSDDRYPKPRVVLKSKDLSIESERYIGRKNRKGEWEDVPVKDKYMHEYLPAVETIDLIFIDALTEFGMKPD